MEQLKMHTPDFTEAHIARLAELFPQCVTESRDEKGRLKKAIDFDQLRQELSGHIVEGPQERYQLNWPGKRDALLTANAPIAKTLRPAREESVDFDTTQNLFIEGDNLDALKLLQETYLGKVKLIYIDPPYNTGNDFIYKDDFAEDTDEFLRRSNQKDEEGNRLVANTESNGRFHSDWLSMMYARLRLARNLLADDGIIAVAINDIEVLQCGKLLDEIFGSNNRLCCAPWLSEPSGGKDRTGVRKGHEYVLIYIKANRDSISQEERSTGPLDLRDKLGKYRKGRELIKWGKESLRQDRPSQFFPITSPDGSEVLPIRNDGKEGRWRWGKNNPNLSLAINDPSFFHWEVRPYDSGVSVNGKLERLVPYEKVRSEKNSIGWSTWLDKYGYNSDGTRELKELFDFKSFDTPKPTQLIRWIVSLYDEEQALILDFFAGSSTTAHAVMQLNAEDGGNRQFIMVQLPEPCDEKSEAFKAGYPTIAEISKERIRRAGKKVLEGPCHEGWRKDVGFRVLKVDSSNMADVYYTPDQLTQDQLALFVEHIKPDRSAEDLLFQVLLDWGVDLRLPIARKTVQGKQVYFVDGNALLACFERGIDEPLVKELAAFKPLRAVFQDNGFANDAAKINAGQIFRQLSPMTEVKVI